MPSKEILCSIFEYNKKSGKLLRKGKPVGWYDPHGNRYVTTINGKHLYQHRIIWVMHNGDIPEGYIIDHIDHNSTNNRIENLRCIPRSENHKNMSLHPANTTGHSNISWNKLLNKYQVTICLKGKSTYFGVYSSIDDAIIARDNALTKHKFHPNHGKI